MNDQPLVSVIVTTYNSARTLWACLNSIASQNEKNIELIVVDNCSTDETRKIAEQFTAFVFEAGPERSAQRNFGCLKAKAEIVLIIDSDMVLEESVISECISLLNSGAPAVAIPERSFGSGFWSDCKAFERSLFIFSRASCAARGFRREDFVDVGGYDESLTGLEDWDLSMRICSDADLEFTEAMIRHDEGTHSLRSLFLKKLYYARSLPRFLRKHGKAALRKLGHSGSASAGNLRVLAGSPRLSLGIGVMKTVETLGAGVGLCAFVLSQARFVDQGK